MFRKACEGGRISGIIALIAIISTQNKNFVKILDIKSLYNVSQIGYCANCNLKLTTI